MTKQAIDLKRGMKSKKSVTKGEDASKNEEQKMLVYKDMSDDEDMNQAEESASENSYGSADESEEEIKQIALKQVSVKKRPRNVGAE